MRKTEPLITDAEFRVLNRSRLESWMRQLPNPRDRLAFVLVAAGGLALLGAVLLGLHGSWLLGVGDAFAAGTTRAGFLVGLLLAGFGCLVSTQHQRKCLACLALFALLTMTGCSEAPSESAAAQPRTETPTPEEARANLHEAMKYRDPYEGFVPKPIPMPGARPVDKSQENGNDGQ